MNIFISIRAFTVLISFILLSAGCDVAWSQGCANTKSNTANYDFVRLNITASAAHLTDGIRRGMAQWNNSSCVDGLTPYPYPQFDTLSTGGQATIRIVVRDYFSKIPSRELADRFTSL